MGNISQLPPVLAAWSPDLIFALVGGYLILKVRRRSIYFWFVSYSILSKI